METFTSLYALWKLRRCARVGRAPCVRGHVWIHGRGQVLLGDGVVLDAAHFPIELHAQEPGSRLVLGDGVYIGGGTSIEAVVSVTIGARTRVGSFTKVMDNHFHPLWGNRHFKPPSAPVVIGEDVEIGSRAIFLAGADVGNGATGRAGAVITRRTRVRPGGTA